MRSDKIMLITANYCRTVEIAISRKDKIIEMNVENNTSSIINAILQQNIKKTIRLMSIAS